MLLLRRFDDGRMTDASNWICLILRREGRLGLGKTGGKGSAGFQRAFDQETAAMAVNDMFYQRKSEPGSALRAAVPDVHPVKPLGKARQVLRRNARAEIAHQ